MSSPLRRPLSVLAVLLLPMAARAQGIGGGGAVFSGVLSWIQSNLISDLITLAIIAVGAGMLFMRLNWLLVLSVCIGGWIMLNASTIRGLL